MLMHRKLAWVPILQLNWSNCLKSARCCACRTLWFPPTMTDLLLASQSFSEIMINAQVAAVIPNPAAPKKGRKDKDTEEDDEAAQSKQFLHELPPKMGLMMNRYACCLHVPSTCAYTGVIHAQPAAWSDWTCMLRGVCRAPGSAWIVIQCCTITHNLL